MGSHSSTRWNDARVRACVESCYSLAAPRKQLPEGSEALVRWPRSGVTARAAVVGGDFGGDFGGPALLVRHDYRGGTVQLVRLAATRPTYGGRRWWFLCPRCGRRAGRLHLPFRGGGRPEFACRRCHGLTYESAQGSRGASRRLFLLLAGEWGCSYREARDRFRREWAAAYLYEPRRLCFGPS